MILRRRLTTLIKFGLSLSFIALLLIWILSGLQERNDSPPTHHDQLIKENLPGNPRKQDSQIVHENRIALPAPAINPKLNAKYDAEIAQDEARIVPGLGDGGQGVYLEGEEAKRADELMKKEAFNLLVSNKIAYNRSLNSPIPEACQKKNYDTDLPSASVIIIFTNEAWSALIRTVHSVINRSPPEHLKEILLVDDFSDRIELQGKLERYIQTRLPSKVRLIRLKERHGLIRARLAGAQEAIGDVVIFLDSHCEAAEIWLEPLLQRIKENRKAVVVPIIEVIDDKTLAYYRGSPGYFQVGGFTWSGHFTWIEVPDHEVKRRGHSLAPTRSPTMAGGLFAMDRKYFWELGSYDQGMEVWGGENLEMSFRIWMCGGTLETIPCSHVGHIFRSFHPYTFPGNKDTHGINTARMAHVWMDDYKRLFFKHRPDLLEIDIGDIAERKALRERLQCKSFNWFLENIIPEKFILDEHSLAYGQVRNNAWEKSICLDMLQRNEDNNYIMGLYPCHQEESMSQFISLSKSGQLRREEMCASAEEKAHEGRKGTKLVMMTRCDENLPDNQQWELTEENELKHKGSGKCLDRGDFRGMTDAFLSDCQAKESQTWTFSHFNEVAREKQ